ncbi:acyltransferase domain-containing protein [Streptomyces abikoensis]|uniref:acyltransferase domain-containing protein n=1 Tax=Streptomyces abikoensis TaxID=97398 RepID=UPI003689FA30
MTHESKFSRAWDNSDPLVVLGAGRLIEDRHRACSATPAERLLEAARTAVEQAGIDPTALREHRTGVIAGTLGRAGATGELAGHFGLTGPTISLNTTDTPALAALHLATQTLRADACSFVLLGAEKADETGALLVARLSVAHTARARVLAVVRGSAVVHTGSSGDPERATADALAAGGLTPDDIAPQTATGLTAAIDTVRTLQSDTPRTVGISESGADGTTAHVILQHPRVVTAATELPWVFTAEGPRALRAKAAALAAHLDTNPAPPADVARTLLTTPPAPRRAVVVGRERTELRRGLTTLATDSSAPHLISGTAIDDPRPVFVFPGQGSQWAGMAAELLETSEVFHDSVQACANALSEFVDWSLLDVLRETPGAPPLRRVDVLQPTLWATMVSLAELWRSHGVRPAAVVGHCYGEIAAAHVAGGLSLRDAARLLARRSRAWLRLVGKGTVISVGTSAEEITRHLAAWPDSVELAAVNGPRSVALAGPPDVLDDMVAELTAQNVYAKRIPGVDTVGHCSQVDILRDHLLDVLRPVSPTSSDVPFYSTVDGTRRDTATLDTDYWYLNTRSQVRFHDAIRSLLTAGHRAFIEVSPHPLLAMSIEDTAAELGIRDVAVVGTLRRGQGGTRRVLTALAEAYTRGMDVDWSPTLAGTDSEYVDLPELSAADGGDDNDGDGNGARPSWAEGLAALPGAERTAALVDLVRGTVAEVLEEESADAIHAEAAFKEIGLGSLTAVRLRNRLNAATGLYLPTTVAFDHPTPAALAHYLESALFGHGTSPDAPVLAAIEQAEAALAQLPATEGASTQRIQARLEALLARLRRTGGDTAEAGDGDDSASVADPFESADDEEMFALIGERFGIS